MDFSKRQADPRRHLLGLTFVILFHAFIVYMLMTGLAKKVVEVVRAPIETKLIEEVKKPPPPPEVLAPPPPRLEAPPPPFIPPPEIRIETPPPPQPTITAVTPAPPPTPVVIAPVAPAPAEQAPAPAPAPPAGPVNVRTVCTKMPTPEIPGVSVTGTISMTARMNISAGRVTSVEVSQFRGTTDRRAQRALASAVETAVRGYACTGDAVAVQEFVFNIN